MASRAHAGFPRRGRTLPTTHQDQDVTASAARWWPCRYLLALWETVASSFKLGWSVHQDGVQPRCSREQPTSALTKSGPLPSSLHFFGANLAQAECGGGEGCLSLHIVSRLPFFVA